MAILVLYYCLYDGMVIKSPFSTRRSIYHGNQLHSLRWRNSMDESAVALQVTSIESWILLIGYTSYVVLCAVYGRIIRWCCPKVRPIA